MWPLDGEESAVVWFMGQPQIVWVNKAGVVTSPKPQTQGRRELQECTVYESITDGSGPKSPGPMDVESPQFEIYLAADTPLHWGTTLTKT